MGCDEALRGDFYPSDRKDNPAKHKHIYPGTGQMKKRLSFSGEPFVFINRILLDPGTALVEGVLGAVDCLGAGNHSAGGVEVVAYAVNLQPAYGH